MLLLLLIAAASYWCCLLLLLASYRSRVLEHLARRLKTAARARSVRFGFVACSGRSLSFHSIGASWYSMRVSFLAFHRSFLVFHGCFLVFHGSFLSFRSYGSPFPLVLHKEHLYVTLLDLCVSFLRKCNSLVELCFERNPTMHGRDSEENDACECNRNDHTKT